MSRGEQRSSALSTDMSRLSRIRSSLLLCFLALALNAPAFAQPRIVDEIVFGSCINNVNHPMLDRVLTLPMDLFLFLGDNIYADTTDMAMMRRKYDALKTSRFFRELRTRVPIMATLDDHDMGANDAGADYLKIRESKEEFLRWLDEPADSPRRRREGVYDANIFGPPGKQLQIILLDTRTFRGPLKRGTGGQKRVGGPYVPNPDTSSTLLGEVQWAWLTEQLAKPAELRLIGSSIQFVSEFSGAEAWANLPHEKQRMLDVLRESKAGGVLFVSGDRHWCELSRMDGPLGYPLYDLTASALTQPHPRGTPSENKYRAIPTTYHDVNVGQMTIDWGAADPAITWKIIDLAGKTRIEHSIRLSELQGRPL
jgi:alkaline phosphatase D